MSDPTVRHGHPLDLLSDLHHLLASERTLDDLLRQIVSVLVAGVVARGATIWIYESDERTGRRAAEVGEPWPGDLADPSGLDLPSSFEGDGTAAGLVLTVVPGEIQGRRRALLGIWTDVPPQGETRRLVELFAEHAALAVVDDEVLRERTQVAVTLEGLVDATDAGILLVSPDPESRLMFANERVERLLGVRLRDQVGRPAREVVAQLGKVRFKDPDALEKRFLQGMADPEAVVRDRFEMADGRILERYSAPARSRVGGVLGRVTIYRDATRRERLIEELSGLAELSAVFAEGGEFPVLLERAEQVIAKVMAVKGVAVRRWDRVRGVSVLLRPALGMSEELQSYSVEQPLVEDDPVIRDIAAGRSFTTDRPDDPEARLVQDLLEGLGLGAAAMVPLPIGGVVTGVLTAFGTLDGRRFADRDVRLLKVLASQLAPFLSNAALVQSQLEVARRLERVDAVASEIVAGRSIDEIADRAVRAVTDVLGMSMSRLWLVEEGRLSIGASTGDGPLVDLAAEEPTAPVRQMLESRQRLVTEDLVAAGVEPAWVRRERLVAFAGFPLTLGEDFLGVLTGYSRTHIRPEILDLVGSVAKYAAAAIGKTRAYERERTIAGALQQGLIPRAVTDLPGLQIAARYFSATSGAEVGGDLYDAFPIDGRTALFVADVSGKGVAAASTAGLVRHSLRALATREAEGPEILQYLNRTVVEQGEGQFVTAALGLYDPATKRLSLTVAGHPPPLLRRRGGEIDETPARGSALGLFEETTYEAVDIQLEAGDVLLLYTDGILECRSETEGMYGTERLLVSAARERASAEEIVEAVVTEATEFCGGAFGDDVALVAVRVQD